MSDTIENMLRDPEQLRMIIRILIGNYGLDVENKIVGYDKETQQNIEMSGRQVRLSMEEMMVATKNMALGLDYDTEKDEVILFAGYVDTDKDGVRYDN